MSEDTHDASRRKALVTVTTAASGIAVIGAATPFLASLGPSERAKAAGAPVEVHVAPIRPGELHTVEWRGRPVWILRRTEEMVRQLHAMEVLLSDPASNVRSQQPDYARNRERSIKLDVLVTVALCTHLGCIPTYYPKPDSIQPGWRGGFYCPCHGSKFDLAGRVYRGSPAPTNLLIPPHRYLSESVVRIGDDGKA